MSKEKRKQHDDNEGNGDRPKKQRMEKEPVTSQKKQSSMATSADMQAAMTNSHIQSINDELELICRKNDSGNRKRETTRPSKRIHPLSGPIALGVNKRGSDLTENSLPLFSMNSLAFENIASKKVDVQDDSTKSKTKGRGGGTGSKHHPDDNSDNGGADISGSSPFHGSDDDNGVNNDASRLEVTHPQTQTLLHPQIYPLTLPLSHSPTHTHTLLGISDTPP